MNEETFRETFLTLIDARQSKIWLTRVNGPRLEFLWSAGTEQLKPIRRLAREGDYILLGQQVPDAVIGDLQDGLRAFIRHVAFSDAV